jgi:hypothetical protein
MQYVPSLYGTGKIESTGHCQEDHYYACGSAGGRAIGVMGECKREEAVWEWSVVTRRFKRTTSSNPKGK